MTATDYVFDGFFKTCDVCGNPRRADEITVRDNIVICNIHPGYRTAKELDRINARRRLPIEKPIRNSKPFNPNPSYSSSEGAIFDLVTTVAPYEVFDNTSDGNPGITGARRHSTAGWALIYLMAIVAEGRRPERWRTRATAKGTELGDYLISIQVGNGVFPTSTVANDAAFGAFYDGTGVYHPEDIAAGCLGLLRLYQQTGTPKYLYAGKLCAHFLVNAQAGNLLTVIPTAKFYGPPTFAFDSVTAQMDHIYYPGSLMSAWAMTLVKSVAGDGSYGGTGTVGGVFTSAPRRTLTTAIAQQKDFWSTGAAEAGSSSVINGFSATTPRAYFNGNAQTWNYDAGSLVITGSWARGIYALAEMDGVTSQVTALWSYLTTLADSETYATADGASDKVIAATYTGTFNPKIAPTTTFDASAGENGSPFYDYASAGLMARVMSSQAPSYLSGCKEELQRVRHRTVEGTPRDGRTQWLGRLGRSGLTFQPWSSTTDRQESVTLAAQTGLLYRYRQGFMGDE